MTVVDNNIFDAAGSLPLEHIISGLDHFIEKTLDDYEAGNKDFHQSIISILTILSSPSLRLQLRSVGKYGELIQSTSKHSKKIGTVQRLCAFVSIDIVKKLTSCPTNCNKLNETELDTSEVSKRLEEFEVVPLHSIKSAEMCIGVELMRLWLFIQRHIHLMGHEGVHELVNSYRSVGIETKTVCKTNFTNHSSSILIHLELMTRTVVTTLNKLIISIRQSSVTSYKSLDDIIAPENETNVISSGSSFDNFREMTQQLPNKAANYSAIHLTAVNCVIELGDLLCRLVVWILPLCSEQRDIGTNQSASKYSFSSILRRSFGHFIITATNSLQLISEQKHSLHQIDGFIQSYTAMLTSPFIPSSLLRSHPAIMSQLWSIALSEQNLHNEKLLCMILCRFGFLGKQKLKPGSSTTDSAAMSFWEILMNKTIQEGKECIALISSAQDQSLVSIRFAANRLGKLLRFIACLCRYFGGSGITEILGGIKLSDSQVLGIFPTDDILQFIQEIQSCILFWWSRMIHCYWQLCGLSSNSLDIHHVLSINDRIQSTETILMLEPLLHQTVDVYEVVSNIVPIPDLLLRSSIFTHIIDLLQPSSLNQQELFSLYCWFLRYHHEMKRLILLITTRFPILFHSVSRLSSLIVFFRKTIALLISPPRMFISSMMLSSQLFGQNNHTLQTSLTKDTSHIMTSHNILYFFYHIIHLSSTSLIHLITPERSKIDFIPTFLLTSFPGVPNLIYMMRLMIEHFSVAIQDIKERALLDEIILRSLWLTTYPAAQIITDRSCNFNTPSSVIPTPPSCFNNKITYHYSDIRERLTLELLFFLKSSLLGPTLAPPTVLHASIAIIQNIIAWSSALSNVGSQHGESALIAAKIYRQLRTSLATTSALSKEINHTQELAIKSYIRTFQEAQRTAALTELHYPVDSTMQSNEIQQSNDTDGLCLIENSTSQYHIDDHSARIQLNNETALYQPQLEYKMSNNIEKRDSHFSQLNSQRMSDIVSYNRHSLVSSFPNDISKDYQCVDLKDQLIERLTNNTNHAVENSVCIHTHEHNVSQYSSSSSHSSVSSGASQIEEHHPQRQQTLTLSNLTNVEPELTDESLTDSSCDHDETDPCSIETTHSSECQSVPITTVNHATQNMSNYIDDIQDQQLNALDCEKIELNHVRNNHHQIKIETQCPNVPISIQQDDTYNNRMIINNDDVSDHHILSSNELILQSDQLNINEQLPDIFENSLQISDSTEETSGIQDIHTPLPSPVRTHTEEGQSGSEDSDMSSFSLLKKYGDDTGEQEIMENHLGLSSCLRYCRNQHPEYKSFKDTLIANESSSPSLTAKLPLPQISSSSSVINTIEQDATDKSILSDSEKEKDNRLSELPTNSQNIPSSTLEDDDAFLESIGL